MPAPQILKHLYISDTTQNCDASVQTKSNAIVQIFHSLAHACSHDCHPFSEREQFGGEFNCLIQKDETLSGSGNISGCL